MPRRLFEKGALWSDGGCHLQDDAATRKVDNGWDGLTTAPTSGPRRCGVMLCCLVCPQCIWIEYYGPIGPLVDYEGMAYIVMALYSYGPIWLWLYIVMALYSYGATVLGR